MRPRIGANLGRFCPFLQLIVCALLCTRAASADEQTSGDLAVPGPRPAAIAPQGVDQPEDKTLPDSAVADLDDTAADETASQEAPLFVNSQDASAGSGELETASDAGDVGGLEAELALGAPASMERDSQRIVGDDAVEPASWGWLDPRTNEVTRVVGALAVVIGVILLLRAAVRRLGGPLLDGGRPSGVLLVLARYPVARGQHLVLLKLGRRLLLCHQAKGMMATLCEIENEDEVAAMLARIEAGSRGRDAARFEKMLEEFNQEHRRRSYTSRGDGQDLKRALAQAPVIDLTRRTGVSGGSASGGAAGWLKLRKAAS